MPKTHGTIPCRCVICGAEFFEYPYRAAIRQFCSRPCQDSAFKGAVMPPRSEEHRARLSAAMKAYWDRNPDARAAFGERFKGEAHPDWQGGTSTQNCTRLSRGRWQRFRREYLTDHANICEVCGTKARVLHHRTPVRKWPEGEYVESNIQVLCPTCHTKVEKDLRKADRA